MIRYLYIPFFSAPSKEDEGLTMTPVPGLPVPCVFGSCSVLGRGLADLMPKRAWVGIILKVHWDILFHSEGVGEKM